jgi:hypothetical protein
LEFVCTCSRYDEDVLSPGVAAQVRTEDLAHHAFHAIANYRLADTPADRDAETRSPDWGYASNHDERPQAPALAMPLKSEKLSSAPQSRRLRKPSGRPRSHTIIPVAWVESSR